MPFDNPNPVTINTVCGTYTVEPVGRGAWQITYAGEVVAVRRTKREACRFVDTAIRTLMSAVIIIEQAAA